MEYIFKLFIPVGLIISIISIKYTIRFANSEIIYEMPFINEEGTFTIANKGIYGLWLSGKMYEKTPLGEFGLNLARKDTGETVPLSNILMRTSISGTKNGRTELYTFQADEGIYELSINNKVSYRDKIGSIIINAIIKKPVDYNYFSIQVRKHSDVLVLMLCIWGITLGIGIAISAIVLPIILK